ncbi:MAG: AAA family ATPase, partial [Spirulina sp.]
MMSGLNISIPNYQISELIHESDRTLVYRGRRKADSEPVAIKLMRHEYPSFQELVQFRNQYAIAKNLDMEGIVKPYALERYNNRYALIMEDFEGISLDRASESLSIPQFLVIAIQLTEILHQLHQNRIIHKDIKPANILIHLDTQHVKLIDFSISSLLPKETQTIQTLNILEGTLAYLSPEQTGRMNRGIDYRSDFYSLGVTFYELLTGKLPFESDDPLELIHAHIAKPPSPTPHSLLPTPLANIVMKLMAKNAEERYQSALGLKYDLEKCLSQWQETGKIESFELGEEDRCDRFLIPEKLYGRETEVQILLDAFARVTSPPAPRGKGGVEMVLVAGYSGVGKTAVISEIHKPIVEKRSYFIKGKYDQFNRNIPFSAFVQAFRDLMGQLLGESDTQLQRWKTKIIEALGDNGRVIIETVPELERIIGEQPPVPELEGSAAQNRFNVLFQKFVKVFATVEHPLTLFLDDLQWVDAASLNLLKVLMDESEGEYLLVLGAYRDNEVFPAHPLMLARDELQKREANIRTLTLNPLSKKDINRLVADTLLCSVELAAPLSRLVYQKTRGNPFFTTQFLQGLHEDGWIVFIPPSPLNPPLVRGEVRGDGGWQCDLTRVQQLSLTDDVVEFMVGRLQKLPEATQNVLKLAACIGNQFDLETLAVVCEKSQTEVATDLWGSLQEGFVIPGNETYKFFQGDREEVGVTIPSSPSLNLTPPRYRFLHDRVQQAAYALISDSQKQATHLKIGRQLWHNLPESEQEDRRFTIVNHLNIGGDLILDRSERDRIARLNLQAAQKAKASVAYESSRRYCYAGQKFLSEESWQENYSLRFALAIATIEAEYFNHNLPVARHLSLKTLEKAQT